MCGYIAICGDDVSNVILEKYDSTLIHRGPDDQRGYISQSRRCAMRFFRLSIIDLETGAQPVTNLDGSIVSMFNGEIYNYMELRQELIQDGIEFKSKGDSEVIPFLFEKYGKNFVSKLRGMFSIVLWDERDESLWVFRDRFGIKPLYWSRHNGNYIFSSEAKPILKMRANRELSPDAVIDFLSFGYVIGEKTIFEGVFKLPPAHLACIKKSEISIERYWKINTSENIKTSKEQVLKEFDETIALHLRSDVKCGAFLSGGYDSGLIVARASTQLKRLGTYTLDFCESNHREAHLAEMVAKKYDTDHHTYKVSHNELLGILPEVFWFSDEPIADSGILSSYYVTKMAKNDGCKVVLAGVGGDELFAGYEYHVPTKREIKSRLLHPIIRFIGKFCKGEFGVKLFREAAYFTHPERHLTYKTAIFPNLQRVSCSKKVMFNGLDCGPIKKRLCVDLNTYVPDNLMVLLDRSTMALSVEGRVPFLDHVFAEKVLSVPEDILVPNLERKGFMKSMLQGILPSEAFSMPKKGFNSPVKSWMSGPVGDDIMTVMRSSRFKQRSIYQPLFEKYKVEDMNYHQLWTLFSFEVFCRIHVDQLWENPKDINFKELVNDI